MFIYSTNYHLQQTTTTTTIATPDHLSLSTTTLSQALPSVFDTPPLVFKHHHPFSTFTTCSRAPPPVVKHHHMFSTFHHLFSTTLSQPLPPIFDPNPAFLTCHAFSGHTTIKLLFIINDSFINYFYLLQTMTNSFQIVVVGTNISFMFGSLVLMKSRNSFCTLPWPVYIFFCDFP
jgi:hypothetical protein